MICPLCRSSKAVVTSQNRDSGYCKKCKRFFKRGKI